MKTKTSLRTRLENSIGINYPTNVKKGEES
jgi:hypothetical protein